MSDGYHVGDTWVLAFITTNSTGARTNSTTLTVGFTRPNGTTGSASASLVAGATGSYTASIDLTSSGYWHAVVRSTGSKRGAQPAGITVMPVTPP